MNASQRRRLVLAIVLQLDAVSAVAAFVHGLLAMHSADLARFASTEASWAFATAAALRAARRAVKQLRSAFDLPADESAAAAPASQQPGESHDNA